MRRLRGFCALLLIGSSLTSPTRATIIDTGDVQHSGNDLLIGNTADGSRTVDADIDGPHDSVVLGFAQGAKGELRLENSATFSTTGRLTAGVDGSAALAIFTGSMLATGETLLGSAAITLDGGSSWINGGSLATVPCPLGHCLTRFSTIVVKDGASVSTAGVPQVGYPGYSSGIGITVDGQGSSWWNDGVLELDGSSSMSVLNGATARDNDVFVDANGFYARAIVDGIGSTWDTGSFRFLVYLGDEQPGLLIRNGGRVISSSAVLGDVVTIESFRVDGLGSIWSIAGRLESRAEVLGLAVTGGATLETGDADFGGSAFWSHHVAISGAGSRWDLRGDLSFSPPSYGSLGVSQGASLLIQGDSTFSFWDCDECSRTIGVAGAGSMFRTEGTLTLGQIYALDPSPRALFGVGDGAKAEAGREVTAFSGWTIGLHGGRLAAPMVALQGGWLAGEGIVDAEVLNNGRVAPGAGFGALAATSFEQGPDGTLQVRLETAALAYSRLEILEHAELGGTLEVTLADDYQPLLGDTFQIVRAGSVAGRFATYVGPDLGKDQLLVPIYEVDGVKLRVVLREVCGNAVVEAGEACDDGNPMSGDGCDSNCSDTGCGNSIRAGSEECDDGNLGQADGCSATCRLEICGNAILDPRESCDDGNVASGDGCDANCSPTACGNEIITSGEGCDDGNTVAGDGCDSNCTATGCGNDVLTAPEQCDDGNVVSDDGCDANCTTTACGNGIAGSGEDCDDGDLESGDGCDANCTATSCGNGTETLGEACDDGNGVSGDGCDGDCTLSECGNGTTAGSEACDDGNTQSGDGCDSDCTVTACGNGIATTGEQCDDGNSVDQDQCSNTCSENRGPQSRPQIECIVSVNKGIARVARAQAKVNEQCLESLVEGQLGSNPAALSTCLQADAKKKVTRAKQGLQKLERSKCLTAEPPELALGGDRLAGAPAASALPIQLLHDLLGGGVARASKNATRTGRCQTQVVKQSNIVFDAVWDVIRLAKADALYGSGADPAVHDGQISDDIYESLLASRKVMKASEKLRARVIDACGEVDSLLATPGCEVGDAGTVADCVDREARCQACQLLRAADVRLSVNCDAFDNGDADRSCHR